VIGTRQQHHGVADVFAALHPSPGGPLASVATTESEWGPVMPDMSDRAYCSLLSTAEVGWSRIVDTDVDRVELSGVGRSSTIGPEPGGTA
jgi:hypothetical protein